MWDPYTQFEKTILPNGLTLYVAHWAKKPWQVMAFLFHSGFEFDPIGKEGLCHFVEHSVCESTPLSPTEIEHFFTRHGGSVNLGLISYAQNLYSFFIPKKRKILITALDIFGSMLFEGDMHRMKIDRERKVILGEWRKQYPVDFIYQMKLREIKMILKNTWLERFPDGLGSPKTIKQITVDDLQNYYNTHFTPANLSVVAVGGWNIKQLSETILQSPFAKMKSGERASLHHSLSEITPPQENRYEVNLSNYIQEDTIHAGEYRTIVALPKNYSLRALQILRRMLIECLFEEIREQQGLAYNVEISYRNYRDFYIFEIECNGLSLEALPKVERIIENTFILLQKNKKLFQKIKKQLLAQQKMIDINAHQLCDNAVDDLIIFHRVMTNEEYYKEIEDITFERILEIFPALAPQKRWTLIINPI